MSKYFEVGEHLSLAEPAKDALKYFSKSASEI